MKGLEFPLVSTKVEGLNKKFDINSPSGRKKYFEAKIGTEIAELKEYLKTGTFLAFFLGKKGAGKGTYSKLFTEIFGEEKVAHVSVGDIVRDTHKNWEQMKEKGEVEELKKLYRGYISFEEAVERLHGRSTEGLLPTEFILAVLKLYIEKHAGKTIFIDGLPRSMDQLSYSLYFRDLINFRDDPDFFILIDIPESVIEERIKYRVVCPNCQLSRNTKLLVTSDIGYDEKSREVFLKCDNPDCNTSAKMTGKEGDDKGLEAIRGRLDTDEEILRKVFGLHGVPKILLRNHVPVSEAKKDFDEYELTPEFVLDYDEKSKKVKVTEKPWVIKDDSGIDSHSLMSPAVIVSMVKQLVEVLI